MVHISLHENSITVPSIHNTRKLSHMVIYFLHQGCITCTLVHLSFFPWSFVSSFFNKLSNYNILTANGPFKKKKKIKSQGYGLIMRIVFYDGVGLQVFMESLFVTRLTPKP
jgi:hypothetical protein